jgi:hypothetical protein
MRKSSERYSRTKFVETLASRFCDDIANEIKAGKGIVPLVGAGLSSSAGIPTTPELLQYLRLCIVMALGLDHEPKSDAPARTRWHPRLNEWPAMRGDWVARSEKGGDRLRDVAVSLTLGEGKGKTTSYQDICKQALGALTDWRLALQFLSRVKLPIAPSTAEARGPEFAAPARYQILTSIERDLCNLIDSAQSSPVSGKLNQIVKQRDKAKGMVEYATKRIRMLQQLAKDVNGVVTKERVLELGHVDPHIVDSFFTYIVGGKMPSMTHRMVVHFTHALRTRVVLSLNFDDLLEQAFREGGVDLTVVDVHQRAGLPPWGLLGPQHSLIKLHGGRYGLRADFSLDEVPTESDRHHFRSYLLGTDWHATPEAVRKLGSDKVKYHLLVAGVSGRDLRVRLLVKDALRNLKDLKVFWCCHSRDDEATLKKYFGNFSDRVVSVRSSHLGLLLWEVYQRTTKSLPPGGLEFPASWQNPAPPTLLSREIRNIADEFAPQILEVSTWLRRYAFSGATNGQISNVRVLEASELSNGDKAQVWKTNSLGWQLFSEWNEARACIWIDCEDVLNVKEIKIRMLQAVGRKAGETHQKPPLAWPEDYVGHELKNGASEKQASDEMFFAELKQLLEPGGKSWVFFFNLRGAHRYCASQFERLRKTDEQLYPNPGISPEDWLATQKKDKFTWASEEIEQIRSFITELASRVNGTAALLVITQASEFDFSNFKRISIHPTKQLDAETWAGRRAKRAIAWTNGKPHRKRLLRALLLSQQVRHYTTLVTRSVLQFKEHEKQWENAWEQTEEMLRQLVELRIVRYRPGGFLWMHWEVREYLRCLLFKNWNKGASRRERATLHLGIADWQMTFFHATGDPLAVFQAVYHRCRVAKLSMDRHQPNLVRARGALCEAANHLALARSSVLARGQYIDAEKCLSAYVDLLNNLAAQEALRWRGYRHRGDRATKPKGLLNHHERNLRFLLMVLARAQLYRVSFYRDLGKSDKVFEACAKFNNCKSDLKSLGVWQMYQRYWPEEDFWNDNFFSWERAVVNISLRRYEESEHQLHKLAQSQGLTKDLGELRTDTAVWKCLDSWVSNKGRLSSRSVTSHRYSARRLMMHILRRRMEVLLLRAEVNEMTGGFSGARRQYLHQAQLHYLGAQVLPRYVTDEENSRLRVEDSRLHSVMAGVLALGGDHQGVQRQINEAAVALGNVPESEKSIAEVVVDLRRIYCKLAQFRNLKRLQRFKNDFCRGVSKSRSTRLNSDIAMAHSLLTDIGRILDVVEHRMTRHRKSLWWWMTMIRYRMVCLEYGALLDVCSRKAPYSRLKKNHVFAPRYDTDGAFDVANRLMRDVCRRTTFDSFQLARIAHSYVNFLKFSRRWGNVEEAYSVLVEAINRIQAVNALRLALAQLCASSRRRSRAEDPVQKYIRNVLRELHYVPKRTRRMGTRKVNMPEWNETIQKLLGKSLVSGVENEKPLSSRRVRVAKAGLQTECADNGPK